MLDAERLLSHPELPRTGVVIPVAPFGRPVPQGPWIRFQEATGVPVVIDGAASFGGVVETPPRFFGEIPVALSFHATKSFATGEGGAVACSRSDVVERVTQALNFGFAGSRDSAVASTNGKMSEYHAAVGLAELDGWAAKEASLRSVAERYRARLEEPELRSRLFVAPDVSSTYVLFLCRDESESESVRKALTRHGADYRLWYETGVHHQTHFANLPHDDLPTTDRIAPRLLGLPVADDLGDEDLDRIIAGLREGLSRRGRR